MPAGVLMAPVVPGFTTQPARLRRTLQAIADHGVRLAGANLLRLQGGARAHFFEFLAHDFPQLVPRYEQLYARTNAPRPYADRVRVELNRLAGEVGVSRGVTGRCAPEVPPGDAAEPQASFDWKAPDRPAVSARRAAPQSAARSAGAC